MSKNYRELQTELDVIMEKFERAEQVDVDELLADYEKGKKLIGELESYLKDAELRIEKKQK